MKPWCREHGLTEEGARLAETALPIADALVRVLMELGDSEPAELAHICVEEAVWRRCRLRERSKGYAAKYLRENGGSDDPK